MDLLYSFDQYIDIIEVCFLLQIEWGMSSIYIIIRASFNTLVRLDYKSYNILLNPPSILNGKFPYKNKVYKLR